MSRLSSGILLANFSSHLNNHHINSFLILIKHHDKVKLSTIYRELDTFIRAVLAYGHLARFNEEYQQKYFEITAFFKAHWGGPKYHFLR